MGIEAQSKMVYLDIYWCPWDENISHFLGQNYEKEWAENNLGYIQPSALRNTFFPNPIYSDYSTLCSIDPLNNCFPVTSLAIFSFSFFGRSSPSYFHLGVYYVFEIENEIPNIILPVNSFEYLNESYPLVYDLPSLK